MEHNPPTRTHKTALPVLPASVPTSPILPLARRIKSAVRASIFVPRSRKSFSTKLANVVLSHLCDHSDKAGYFRLAFRTKGAMSRFVAGWANLRASCFGLPYGDQGLLIRRDHYGRVGRHPDIPLMEDVAITRALKGQLLALNATAHTSATRYQSQGWLKRGTHNLITLMRYLIGTEPQTLANNYNRR